MFLANAIHEGDSYKRQPVYLPNGRHLFQIISEAKLTDTFQTAIPLFIYAVKPVTLNNNFPPLPMTLPIGAQIERIDFRLPKTRVIGEEWIQGVELPAGCTIIGTSGEKIKVSPTSAPFTPLSPSITCVGGTYPLDGTAVLSRASGVTDLPLPNLLTTLSAPLTFQLTCSNNIDSGAGTGIRLSVPGATAFVYVEIIYTLPGDAVKPYQFDLPPM